MPSRRTLATTLPYIDGTLRLFGAAPTYLLKDNEPGRDCRPPSLAEDQAATAILKGHPTSAQIISLQTS